MKMLVIAFLVVAVSCQSVLTQQCSYQECLTYKRTLDDIDRLFIDESNAHNFDLYHRGQTYYSRAQYILSLLNGKIPKSNPRSNNNRNSNRASSSCDCCKQLEEEIVAKGKGYGLEKIGLEDSLTRLRKVLNYQDERYRFQAKMLEQSKIDVQAYEERQTELDNTIESLNSTNNKHLQMLKQKDAKIASLEKEKKKLQAKVNCNAPSIHGETGKIYQPTAAEPNNTIPIETAEPVDPSTTSTTEAVPPEDSTVTEETDASSNFDVNLRSTS